MERAKQIRRGVTSIELLASVAVLLGLLAIVSPSIQQVRAQARFNGCRNNCRQLAVASQSFHGVHNRLPATPYVCLNGEVADRLHPGVISAFAQLLPHLDQMSLYAEIDYSDPGACRASVSTTNRSLRSTPLPVLTCPGDVASGGMVNYRVCQGIAPGASRPQHPARGSYYSAGSRDGRLIHATFARIVDGLSQTSLISERLVGDSDNSVLNGPRDVAHVRAGTPTRDAESMAAACASVSRILTTTSPHFSQSGDTWIANGYEATWYNHILPPNAGIVDCTTSAGLVGEGAVSARSLHAGGVFVAFADASVRFVGEAIDVRVWRACGTRDGRESERIP